MRIHDSQVGWLSKDPSHWMERCDWLERRAKDKARVTLQRQVGGNRDWVILRWSVKKWNKQNGRLCLRDRERVDSGQDLDQGCINLVKKNYLVDANVVLVFEQQKELRFREKVHLVSPEVKTRLQCCLMWQEDSFA